VRGLLDLRLAALAEDDRVLLDAASVAGFDFDPDLVARMLGRERLSVLQALARLERRTRLVRSSGAAFSFDHHLLVETVYEALPPSLRSEYHGRLAEAIADRNHLELAQPEQVPADAAVQLVGHLLRGPRPEEAAPLLAKAVDCLHRRNAYAAVFETIDLGLSTLKSLDLAQRCDLHLLQAEVADTLGRGEEEMAAVDSAIAAAEKGNDGARVARCRLARGRVLLQGVGQIADSAAEAAEARRLARIAGDEVTEVRAIILLGSTMFRADRLPEARVELERAVGLAAGRRDRALECEALERLGRVRASQGDTNAAIELLGRALRSAEEMGLTRVASWARTGLGIALSWASRHAEACRYLEAAVVQSRERGALREEAVAAVNLASQYSALGHLDEAARVGERARRLAREIRLPHAESCAEGALALNSRLRGDFHSARESYRSAISLASTLGGPYPRAKLLIYLAALTMDEGGLEEAEQLLDEARGLVRDASEVGASLCLAQSFAELARCRGERERALEILAEVIARQRDSDREDLAFNLLRAGSLVLDLGRSDEALPHLLEAEGLAAETFDLITGVLPAAYLALAGARDPRSVIVSENVPVETRAEAHLVLHRAGAGGDHLTRARALCEHLSRHLEGDGLAQFWRWNPIARGVLEQESRVKDLA
jgi:tetratricopeptide (TPR) repeat protein